ncbi:MAG: tRNA uridine-5-carboxymethylaminomethyl(34) synthesis GTPase MnmE [Proteobacteria bacterium]|nr:tRNA uridine-5-carboxymethylaminomethyl(34) synthesis GTPase MnmE [Pseudomonadota bacterium]MCH9004170.1 tRNA uridine-5-carboxymethylaminomethyl(34) synthesis GTPase MnmE [Pseudomonadota bacterium]
MPNLTDTIVAAATPPGTGGIGIVRVSGDKTEQIARTLLGSLPEPRSAAYRAFRNSDGEKLDAGLALYFPAPASYTGESVLELHGHGGPLVISQLVESIVEQGARRAEPGEFSQRAFLNDKLDLVQAEAIADLINAGTAQAARAALRSLSGTFSRAVAALAEQLVQLRLHVEAAIDFPEEEIDFLSDDLLQRRLDECAGAFALLQQEVTQGRVLRDGFQVVIVGRPNVGKSSLLNLLSGQDAAIVTEVAGTTRDILREQIDIDGLAVELVDTAGLREDPDRVEEEGIRRARSALQSADAVLWIQDATDAEHGDINESLPEGVPVTVVRNKIDLCNGPMDPEAVNLSAKTGEGLEALRQRIRDLAGYENLGEGAFTARKRHLHALERAAMHFSTGRTVLEETRAGELLAEELRLSLQALGEITGAVSSDDLLGRIFSEFCIGK